MSIQISTPHWLRELFEERGWTRVTTPYESRHFGVTTMTSPDGGSASVLVGPVTLRPPPACGRSLQDQFDDWLRRLTHRMDRLIAGGVPIRDMFFTGGGPITLPRWFRDWCAQHVIRIHTVSTNVPPPSLDMFL